MTTIQTQAKRRRLWETLLFLLVPLAMIAGLVLIGQGRARAIRQSVVDERPLMKAGHRQVPAKDPYVPVVYLRSV